MKVLVFMSLFLIPLGGHSKVWQNSYLSMDIPPYWNCKREGTDFVCMDKYNTKVKEALILFTAKQASQADSLDKYEEHLKTPQKIPKGKKTISSRVVHVKRRNINDQAWVDSLHEGSEIPGFYTRYLATTKGNLAVVVTFSAHKQKFKDYTSDFFKAMKSLRVLSSGVSGKSLSDTLNLKSGGLRAKKKGGIGGSGLLLLDEGDEGLGLDEAKKNFFNSKNLYQVLGILFVLLGIILFFILRRRK